MRSSILVKQYRKLWEMVGQVRKAIMNIYFRDEDLDEILKMSEREFAEMTAFILSLKLKRKKLLPEGLEPPAT